MIDEQTEEAITLDEFVTVEQAVVESVVKGEVLNVTEVELFRPKRCLLKKSGKRNF